MQCYTYRNANEFNKIIGKGILQEDIIHIPRWLVKLCVIINGKKMCKLLFF